MSTELQMVIIFGFFILLLMIFGFSMLYFSRCQELKLLYAVLNIVSVILLLVYVVFLYKQSSPIICSIIDYMLKDIRNSNLIYLNIFYLLSFICLVSFTSPLIIIDVVIVDLLAKVLGVIFFGFLSLVEKVYSIVHKFIHWLRNLFNFK